VPEYTKAELWSTIHIGMAIVCACLPPVRPLYTGIASLLTKTSSSMRQRYYSARGQSSIAAKESTGSAISRSGDAIEILPLSHQVCHCGTSNLNNTSAGTFPPSTRYQECSCSARLKDSRMKKLPVRPSERDDPATTVKDARAETIWFEEELENSSRGQRTFLDDAS
jgi:hypothetical protein